MAASKGKKIRIRLKGYDHNVVDKAAEKKASTKVKEAPAKAKETKKPVATKVKAEPTTEKKPAKAKTRKVTTSKDKPTKE